MGRNKYSNDSHEKLIELVRANPIIYDQSQKLYRDILVLKNIWNKISVEMGENQNGMYNYVPSFLSVVIPYMSLFKMSSFHVTSLKS